MPEKIAEDYRAQMATGNLVFLTETNAARLQESIPPELYAQKMQELELKRAAAAAPPFIPMSDAWTCFADRELGPCLCVNASEITTCADCGAPIPEGQMLVDSKAFAVEQQKKNYAKVLEKMRDQLKEKEAQDVAAELPDPA